LSNLGIVRSVVALACLTLGALPLDAQEPTRRDTTPVEVAPITVTVTRTPTPASRVPQAVEVLDAKAVRRGQATLGIDEALTNVPGVYVANRYN